MKTVKVHTLICAAFIAAIPAVAWADDPNDPAMRNADARARDRELTRQLNLEEMARVRQRDARAAQAARTTLARDSNSGDAEYSARRRDYDHAIASHARDRAQYEREMAAWRRAVAACRAGDYSACD